MPNLTVGDNVKKTYQPFMAEFLSNAKGNVHSIYITGSALTRDFDPKHSDINSVIVLKQMDLKLLEWLAPLGKKYGKKKVAAPLIMTPDYIQKSLDVFPIEFLNIQLLHYCLEGEDIFNDLKIDLKNLRNQCERELKVRLIGLWQNYISASGKRKLLTEEFVRSFSGYIPVFRGALMLLGEAPPLENETVLEALEKATLIDATGFKRVLKEKKQPAKLSEEALNTLFEDYYTALEKLGDLIDDMEI